MCSDIRPRLSSSPGCSLRARRRESIMASKPSQSPKQPSANVTQAQAAAQRAKLEVQAERRRETAGEAVSTKAAKGKSKQESLLAKRRAHMTVERTIVEYM